MFKFSSLSFKDGELNMGENSCVDRCTSKYWLVSNLILQFCYDYMQKDNCAEMNARNLLV